MALGQFTEKFRVAGMPETGRIKHLLGDRIGDDGRGGAGPHERDGTFDRFDRRRRVARIGVARPACDPRRKRNDRKRRGKGRSCRCGLDDRDGNFERQQCGGACHMLRVGKQEERVIPPPAGKPCLEGDFRPDAGGIALRQSQRGLSE